VGTENFAALSLSFKEGDTVNSEKLCILLSCRAGWRDAHTNIRVGAAIPAAGLILITLKTFGGNEGRVFSDQICKPEGPHNQPLIKRKPIVPHLRICLKKGSVSRE
jgi:hypothetical protein